MSPLREWLQCPLVGAGRRIQWLFEDEREEGGRGGGGEGERGEGRMERRGKRRQEREL